MIPQYIPVFNKEDRDAVTNYINSDMWLTEFQETRTFEKKIADFLDVKYSHIVSNGTISLSLALLAGDIKAGDKVIVPNLTMIASATAVSLIGAVPVLVDISEKDLTLDTECVKIAIKENDIKALIYVTLNGRSESIYEIKALCQENNILFICDDAQSLGSFTSKGEIMGTIGDISSFSFSMPKIITTGQGGCLVTNNEKYSQKIKELRDFGREKSGVDYHPGYGVNAKFTDLQAVIGNSQMDNILFRISMKKDIYRTYERFLENNKKVIMLKTDLNYVTPWFVDIYVDNKKELQEYLKKNDIGSRVIYPPIHTQSIYKNTKPYPISSIYSDKGLWLPSSMQLTTESIMKICEKINQFYGV